MQMRNVPGLALMVLSIAGVATPQAPPPPAAPPAAQPPAGRGRGGPPLLPTPPLTAPPTPTADGNFVIGPPYAPAPELTVKDEVPRGTIHELSLIHISEPTRPY